MNDTDDEMTPLEKNEDEQGDDEGCDDEGKVDNFKETPPLHIHPSKLNPIPDPIPINDCRFPNLLGENFFSLKERNFLGILKAKVNGDVVVSVVELVAIECVILFGTAHVIINLV